MKNQDIQKVVKITDWTLETCGTVPIPISLSNLSGSGRDGFQSYGTGSGRVWTFRDGIEIFRIEIDLFMHLTAIFLFITRKKEKNIHVQDKEHYFHMNKRKIYKYMFKIKKTIFTNIHFRSRSNCFHRYHISIFFGIGTGFTFNKRDRDGIGFCFHGTGSGSGLKKPVPQDSISHQWKRI